jgi:hypothetical protein
MKQIDLDDLPPRLAKALCDLATDEELTLVRGGVVVGRLRAVGAPPAPAEPADEAPDEERLKEVMEQFNAMIHDEF